jgi:bisphosphoglycerate-independent phosphoglycerate mutase (AlkP superfamily)
MRQELLEAVEEVGGSWLVTADHGNAEDMVQRDKKTGKPLMADGQPRILTSHTLNPVRAVPVQQPLTTSLVVPKTTAGGSCLLPARASAICWPT